MAVSNPHHYTVVVWIVSVGHLQQAEVSCAVLGQPVGLLDNLQSGSLKGTGDPVYDQVVRDRAPPPRWLWRRHVGQ